MSDVAFGKYLIKRELGRGAMGVVYEAHDPTRGVDVALKVLAVASGVAPDVKRRRVERFYREARALSELSHPNIVRIFDEGEFSGRYFFSMEVVRGTTLRDRLQFQGALSTTELIRLALELCDALGHIHSRGVIHRDIKPENIMMMPDGSAKLMDFGVAELVKGDGPAEAGGFHGSPAYMSPEQVAGRPVDGRSDIYSLAVTLYEAATGRRAVEGDSIPVITKKVMTEFPPPPAGLPPFFQAALFRALAKTPDHRYPTARSMADDIRAARVRQPVWSTLPQPSPFPPTPAYTPPAPVYLGAAAAVPAAAAPEPAPLSGSDFILPSSPSPLPAVSRRACAVHPSLPGAEICGACGKAVCYTCLVEAAGRGVLCRACAFAPPLG
jgi:serine/threonine-protein kinase